MRRYRRFIYLLTCVVVVFLALYQGRVNRIGAIKEYREFNTADLAGTITYLSQSAGSTYIRVSGKDTKYMFIPNNSTQGGSHFYTVAQKGDSIIKPPFQDTLYLIKTDEIHPFTFDNFE